MDDATPWTDEEVQDWLCKSDFLGLDGIWSSQSKAIAKSLKAKAFDLNKWWALTPMKWQCEGCGRPKVQIARLNSRGEIMCHLVEHHDHMDQYIARRLAAKIAKMPEMLATIESDRFAKRSATAVAAFDPIIICEDCNTIDGRAKRTVQAPPEFSFTAQDLRKFVVAVPHQAHEIDVAKLREVWAFRKEQLSKRCALADQIVELAANNHQWYEAADRFSVPDSITLRTKGTLLQMADYGPHLHIDQFLALSIAKPRRVADTRKWRVARREAVVTIPSDKEIQWLRVRRSELWAAVEDEWCCAWCGRTKLHTVRKAKTTGWAFNVHSISRIDPETGRWAKQLFCQDCQDTRLCLAKEAGVSSGVITKIDIVNAIRPQAHRPHDLVDDETLDGVIAQLQEREELDE